MEIIPELNIIGEFEAGVNCLQNPSLFSRFFSYFSAGKVYSFWKWSALFLVVATFTGVITRIKLLFLRICRDKLLASSGVPPTQQLDDDYDSSEDEATSSEEDEDDEPTTPFDDRQPVDEDFSVAGSSLYSSENVGLRRRRSRGSDRFSWSGELANGEGVVKLWDSLGLGLDFEEELSHSGSVVSHWESKDRKITSFSGPKFQNLVMCITSPEVILSAGSKSENILFGVYDTRVSSQIPAVYAEWRTTQRGKVVGINSGGGVEKVYVRDDITGALTVGDMRKMETPLENPTEYDRDTC